MLSSVLSFQKYLLYLQSKYLLPLVLVALPTAIKILASQKLLEQIDNLNMFID